jgi:hypothetical protein
MQNFLDGYSEFTGSQTWDAVRYVFVPEGTALPVKGKGWLGRATGKTVNKTYEGHSRSRPERIKIEIYCCDSPALWGLECPYDDAGSRHIAETCEGLGSEALMAKLGLQKKYTRHLDRLVRNRLGEPMLARLGEWTAAGGPVCDRAIDFALWLNARVPMSLAVAVYAAMPEAGVDELVDVAYALDELGVDLAEAMRAFSKHTAWCAVKPRKTYIFCGIHKITLQKPRANLHDFLTDVRTSVEQKGEANELNFVQELAFVAPDGWEHLSTPKRLIAVSKTNGWCAKLKQYWGQIKDGDLFFYRKDFGLAHYSASGAIKQAKSPRNERDIKADMPAQLAAVC